MILNARTAHADAAYGSRPMLGWLVGRNIKPIFPCWTNAVRTDGTWSLASLFHATLNGP